MNILMKIATEGARRGIEFTIVTLGTAAGHAIYELLNHAYHTGSLDWVPFIGNARKKEIEMYEELDDYEDHDGVE